MSALAALLTTRIYPLPDRAARSEGPRGAHSGAFAVSGHLSPDCWSGRYSVTMSQALILFVYALAVARVTRLVTADRITQAPRDWLTLHLWHRVTGDWNAAHQAKADPKAEPPLSVYLLTCPWCVSIYVAAVATPVAYLWGERPWLFVPALALAFSHITGLLAKNGE